MERVKWIIKTEKVGKIMKWGLESKMVKILNIIQRGLDSRKITTWQQMKIIVSCSKIKSFNCRKLASLYVKINQKYKEILKIV